MVVTALLGGGSIAVTDYRCSVGPADEPIVERHGGFCVSYGAPRASRVRELRQAAS